MIHTWHLLTEITLQSWLDDPDVEDESVGLVVDSIKTLEIPQEVVRRVRGSILTALRNAEHQLKSYDSAPGLAICIYIPDHVSLLPVASGVPQRSTGEGFSTGWGFFLIERPVGQPGALCNGALYSIELFLYIAL